MNSPKWRRRKALADLLDVSEGTIDRWRADGKIRAIRYPGGRYRYQLTDELEKELGSGSASDSGRNEE